MAFGGGTDFVKVWLAGLTSFLLYLTQVEFYANKILKESKWLAVLFNMLMICPCH